MKGTAKTELKLGYGEPEDLLDMEKENITLFHELMERISNTTRTFRDAPEVQVSIETGIKITMKEVGPIIGRICIIE